MSPRHDRQPGPRLGRRWLAVLAACALVAGVIAAVAAAQPPNGIVRPDHEASTPLAQLGRELFAGNCASCHGIAGEGVKPPNTQPGEGNIKGEGPSLRGVGALAADFYLRTGRMPLRRAGEQPSRQPPLLNPRERRSLVQFVASLGNGPPIPTPNASQGSVSDGFSLFTEHCAGCHQIDAQGGFATGARVPPLGASNDVDIAEAVRVGPYLMPKFSKRQISDPQLNSIIAYVNSTKPSDNRGGWSIGNLGPVPEGLVTWLIAMVVLVSVCIVIGKRLKS